MNAGQRFMAENAKDLRNIDSRSVRKEPISCGVVETKRRLPKFPENPKLGWLLK